MLALAVHRAHRTSVALLAAAVLVAARASAGDRLFEDPYDVPTAPRPPTLPELTHSEVEATLEGTVGAILPNPGGDRTHGYVQRLSLEIPLGLRRWFVGSEYELAAAGAAGGFRAVSSNLEIHGRTLWASRTGLAFGGGLGAILPTARYDTGGAAAQAALDAASLRPWDAGLFVPDGLGARPFIDVRAVDGPFVAQFREGLDFVVPVDHPGDRRLYAVTGVYLGLWVTGHVAAGLEAFESYVIDAPGVRDGARASVVVSPNVRLVLPWIQPAIRAFTDVGTPLEGANAHVWGFRAALTLVVDPHATLGLRSQ
jgi:hypothetical protein